MDTAWNQYRLRKSVFWMSIPVFFGWMWFWSSYSGMLLVGFAVGVVIIGSAATFYARWKCPRCHNPFVLKGAYGNVLTGKCLHCGLRAYAGPEEVKEMGYELQP